MNEFYNPKVEQEFSDTCAIKSQQLILKDFGINVSELDLVQVSAANGWYNGGTAPEDIGNLLELANIPITKQTNANVFNLVNELAQGHKVIVGLDSDELWHNDSISDKLKNLYDDFFSGEHGDHALIVAGIDTSDPNNIQVIVTDPGSGEEGKPYPLDQFMDAWSDANCFMVSTNIPAPEVVPGMQNFDYELGHIDSVAGIGYHDFQIFNDLSYGLPVCNINDIGMYDYPVSSLIDAYWDVARNDVIFNDIFSPNYLFNEYLDIVLATQMMHNTYDWGFNQMDFNSYCLANPNMCHMIGPDMNPITNGDYNDFLSGSIEYFNSIGDYNSVEYCQQQQMMLEFCDAHNLDFYSTFMS